MEQILSKLAFETNKQVFTDITVPIKKWIASKKIEKGILVVSSMHTSCSLIINENADPNVLRDLSGFMNAIVPEEGINSINRNGEIKYQPYLHSDEGPDDMPAHIKTILTSTTITLSIVNHDLLLGTWQAIYLWEHRLNPSKRILCLHAIGDVMH